MIIATSRIVAYSPKLYFERPCGVILVSPLEIFELRAAQRLLSATLLHYILIADDPAMATRLIH